MNKTTEFYLERAAAAAEEARNAGLDNVRDRALRSEAAWMKLANKTSDVARARAESIAEKAALAASLGQSNDDARIIPGDDA